MPRPLRVEFSKDHDAYLYKYLAKYCPSKEGRSGRSIFQRLVTNERNLWPWSVSHTWQSWRERYVKNADHFDALILSYQRKHNIKPTVMQKRTVKPMPIEALAPSTKRARLEESTPSSEICTEHEAVVQHAGSELVSKYAGESPETPSQEPPVYEPEPTDARPSPPPHSPNDVNTYPTERPLPDLPALQTRHDTLEIPSSPKQSAPILKDGESELHSSPRGIKRKERPRTPSDLFVSEPSSSERVAVDEGTPVTTNVVPCMPPRIVDSLRGKVLVNRKGNAPRAFPRGEEDGTEEVGEDKTQWPPRGRSTKRTTNRPDIKADARHAFSQPQPQPRSEGPPESGTMDKRERRTHQPLDGALSDRRTAAALFSAGLRHSVVPQVKSERREDVTRSNASQVECTNVPTASTAPPPGLVPNSATEAPKRPAPRDSIQSPFRLGPPAPRLPLRSKLVPHPALHRIRRQTIGHEHTKVPSVDLVGLSQLSTSMRSRSSSSAETPVPTRPSRWSLPSVPLVPGLTSRSESPSMWAASPLMRAETLERAQLISLGMSSTPRFMFPPSPARSITAVATNASASTSHRNANPAPTSSPVVPHPPDVPLAASHGLTSILSHMSANHGLAMSVVEAVYARVRSLREADEVLRGMREAAEEFGEREIEKRLRGRHEKQRGSGKGAGQGKKGKERKRSADGEGEGRDGTSLRYVVASEDGEGSEYLPPETSKAAIWKQQLESPSHSEEGKEDRDEEQEECAVEEKLLEVEGGCENESAPFGNHHDFLQVLLENVEAQELEKEVEKGQFHKDIVGLFI